MAFALSRTSTNDSTRSAFAPPSVNGSVSSSATAGPTHLSARQGYRPPRSPSRQQQQQQELDSLKASIASSLNSLDPSSSFSLPANNNARSMYSYSTTAPNMYATPAAAQPQFAFTPKSTKPRGVLSKVFGYKSASSRSKAAAASVAAASQASLVEEIKKRESRQNINRIQAAAENLRERGMKVVRSVKKRISSKSPKEEQPKTWDEYQARYAAVSCPCSLNDGAGN